MTVAGQPVTVHGMLCRPDDPTDTVVVLVPGATYNHVYWDFPLRPQKYSFRRGLNQKGLATFTMDRLGTGLSSRPLSTDLTATDSQASIHAVVQSLRAGTTGGVAYTKVVIGGHSLGSALVLGEVTTYPGDADAVLLTGLSHSVNLAAFGKVSASFYPAAQDPAFAPAQPPYDTGYLTTMPGTRRDGFYSPATADPDVVAVDEATKDVVSSTELGGSAGNLEPVVSQSIGVPVLIVNGASDVLYACTPSGPPCATAEQLLAVETPYFGQQACLRTYVLPDAGHSLNLFPNARKAWQVVAKWVDEFVIHRAPGSTTCP